MVEPIDVLGQDFEKLVAFIEQSNEVVRKGWLWLFQVIWVAEPDFSVGVVDFGLFQEEP